jgi:hypothetical protein
MVFKYSFFLMRVWCGFEGFEAPIHRHSCESAQEEQHNGFRCVSHPFFKKGTNHKNINFTGEARRWIRFTYDKCFER